MIVGLAVFYPTEIRGPTLFELNFKFRNIHDANENCSILEKLICSKIRVEADYDIFVKDDGREFVFIQTDAGAVTAAYERRR